MSDGVVDPAQADPSPAPEAAGSPQEAQPAAAPAMSPGQMLRRAREAQGLHIAALAVALKVPVRKLEALESDRHDELPDVVFTRALAASVCRSLKIDATPILAALPGTTRPRLDQTQGSINAPFRSPRDGPPPSVLDQVSRPAVLAVLALLLAALVLVLLPTARDQTATVVQAPVAAGQPQASPGAAEGAPVTPAAPQAASPAPEAGAASTASVALSGLALPAAAAASAAQADPRTTVAVTVAGSTPTVPSPTLVITPMMSGAAPVDGLLVVKASGSSWVEVTDARGQVPLRRVLESGEQVAINGPPPLAVVVGRADQTTVLVRGKRLDITGMARENVARFEVK